MKFAVAFQCCVYRKCVQNRELASGCVCVGGEVRRRRKDLLSSSSRLGSCGCRGHRKCVCLSVCVFHEIYLHYEGLFIIGEACRVFVPVAFIGNFLLGIW